MIEISIRNNLPFIDVSIRLGETVLDLGLHDQDEAERLLRVLEEAADELREFVDDGE